MPARTLPAAVAALCAGCPAAPRPAPTAAPAAKSCAIAGEPVIVRRDGAAALERWDVPAGQLHLEITENLVMADPRRTMEVLGALRALGVGLSLDDFGTGQTSLAYLRKLALDEIKIDRSFVLELGRDEDAAAIVRSTVQMAQALRLRVVAEGAEDAAAMRRLREFGCELVQGFFLSPPLPATEITPWLRAQASASEDRAADLDPLGDLAAEHQ